MNIIYDNLKIYMVCVPLFTFFFIKKKIFYKMMGFKKYENNSSKITKYVRYLEVLRPLVWNILHILKEN